CPLFMQDGAPCHSAKSTIAYLREHHINLLKDHPPSSPDLNPIEHVWAYIKRSMDTKNIKNAQDLFARVKKEWDAMPISFLGNLISSMPNRIEAVREAEGGNTNY